MMICLTFSYIQMTCALLKRDQRIINNRSKIKET